MFFFFNIFQNVPVEWNPSFLAYLWQIVNLLVSTFKISMLNIDSAPDKAVNNT